MEQINQKVPPIWSMVGLTNRPPQKTYTNILDAISLRYGVSINKILGATRNGEIAYVRALFAYFMRDVYYKKVTYAWLAEILNTDHGTVMKSISKFRTRLSHAEKLPRRIKHVASNANEDYLITYKILSQCL